MKKASITRIICEIAIFAAIGFILDEIQGAIAFSFPSGGSIGFAMIAVLILAYRRGFLPAIFAGLIMGLLDIATKAYIIHPAQLFLDYILPYALVGFAGLFKPLFDKSDNKRIKIMWLLLGALMGGILKFFSHFFAGIFFWNNAADFAWGLNYMSPALYSFVYNIAFIGPSIILCGALLVVLFIRAPKAIMTEGTVNSYVISVEQKQKSLTYSITTFIGVTGLFLFVFFLIKFIQSFQNWSDTDYVYYKFDRDCMVIFITGLFLMVISINHTLRIVKNKFFYSLLCLAVGVLLLGFSGYGLAKVLEMYIEEGKEIKNGYWAWFIPSFVSAIGLITSFFLLKRKEKNKIISTN